MRLPCRPDPQSPSLPVGSGVIFSERRQFGSPKSALREDRDHGEAPLVAQVLSGRPFRKQDSSGARSERPACIASRNRSFPLIHVILMRIEPDSLVF